MRDRDLGARTETAVQADTAAFAVLYAFFNRIPDEGVVEAALRLTPAEVADDEAKSALSLIASYAARTDGEKILEMRKDWTKLFRGVSPDYGPKPPYEALYSERDELEVLSGLAKLYDDHGYCSYHALDNRLDYIGVELGFAMELALARDHALRDGEPEQHEKHGRALEAFLEAHPARWFGKFHANAVPHAATDFYRGVLDLTRRVCC